ncbi:hypothetical protein RCL_jg9885.t1 [Rhizophagus clarus]|uniref:Uncharacterized protein n=1 Tax=Rhizophagus clarus TaxID=94130 RepID=A0A8H3M0X3_9GLOM|nr:hypothetical protein RCL_jg9885.t1 [Rhizophagus clarus]
MRKYLFLTPLSRPLSSSGFASRISAASGFRFCRISLKWKHSEKKSTVDDHVRDPVHSAKKEAYERKRNRET